MAKETIEKIREAERQAEVLVQEAKVQAARLLEKTETDARARADADIRQAQQAAEKAEADAVSKGELLIEKALEENASQIAELEASVRAKLPEAVKEVLASF